MQGAQNGEFFCDSVSFDLKLKKAGKFSLRGPGTRAIMLDGSRIILRKSLKGSDIYEMRDTKIVSYPLMRPKDERYSGFLQIPK